MAIKRSQTGKPAGPPQPACVRLDRDLTVTVFQPQVCYSEFNDEASGLDSDRVMSLRAGKTAAVVLALMFPLLLTACSHAAKPVPPSVMLGYCGSTLQVKPDVVLVVCNTNDITARNLTWSGWGEPTTTAKGSAVVNLCAFSDCANGNYVSVPIEMAASRIVHCAKNTRAYSTLRYVFPGGSPFRGMPSVAYSPVFGTVPPENQTVSLTC